MKFPRSYFILHSSKKASQVLEATCEVASIGQLYLLAGVCIGYGNCSPCCICLLPASLSCRVSKIRGPPKGLELLLQDLEAKTANPFSHAIASEFSLLCMFSSFFSPVLNEFCRELYALVA